MFRHVRQTDRRDKTDIKTNKPANKQKVSNHSFYAQSRLWWNIPEFSAESLCLRQGMATSGRWCHMDHVTPVGGWQLGCPGRCPCSVQASLGGF